MGVIRHADAGYERALEVARERGVAVPMAEEVAEEVHSSQFTVDSRNGEQEESAASSSEEQ
jgi:hypothetical protein